jgi:hypothetical protein
MHVREADCEPCSPDGPRRRPRDALSQGHSSEADGTPALARLSPGLDRLPSLPRDYVDRRANAGC